jgi:glycosyltransferase involved in cell wall biosynthesis
MIEHLDAGGVESRVFVPTYHNAKNIVLPNKNVLVAGCFRKLDRFVFYYKQAKITTAAQKTYGVSTFDCIHAYTLFTDGNCAMQLAQQYGIPYVVAVRNTDINVFLKKRIFLRRSGIRILQNASAVFFLSEAYRQQLFREYVPSVLQDSLLRKAYVIPNGIDDFWIDNRVTIFEPERIKRIANKQLRVVYAGKVDKNKNITATQKALSILRTKGWNIAFTVVGNIVDKQEYKRIMKDPKTFYKPEQPKEALISIYRENDIFIMPSVHESFGLVYAEAMSQGLPVVYTRGQGFDKQFEEGLVGFSVDCHNPEEIANAVLRIVNDYEAIQQRCVEFCRKFCWRNIVNKYIAIYEEVSINRSTCRNIG